MWIMGFLAVLVACEPEPMVGPAPAGPVALQASQSPSELGLEPDADTYVSQAEPETNFGTDTVLRLDGDRRTLLRWDSATIAPVLGGDSLIAAHIELTISANAGGWGMNGRTVSVHPVSEEWSETDATWLCRARGALGTCEPWVMESGPILVPSTDEEIYWSPWRPEPTDSAILTDGLQGVVTLDVTTDVRAVLEGTAGHYKHGWLVKKVDETVGGGVDFGSRESDDRPRLVLTVQKVVPAVTPDTVPNWLYERTMSDSPVISGTFLENILFVIFHGGTPQEDRQAAIDLIDGTVVGGIRHYGDEGYYLVLVEDDHPDVPGQALLEAMEALDGLPQVDLASPEWVFSPSSMWHFRRPNDGQGWGTGERALLNRSCWATCGAAAPWQRSGQPGWIR